MVAVDKKIWGEHVRERMHARTTLTPYANRRMLFQAIDLAQFDATFPLSVFKQRINQDHKGAD